MTSGLWLAVGCVILVLAAIYYFGRKMVMADRLHHVEAENDLRNEARDARDSLRADDAALDELRGTDRK